MAKLPPTSNVIEDSQGLGRLIVDNRPTNLFANVLIACGIPFLTFAMLILVMWKPATPIAGSIIASAFVAIVGALPIGLGVAWRRPNRSPSSRCGFRTSRRVKGAPG